MRDEEVFENSYYTQLLVLVLTTAYILVTRGQKVSDVFIGEYDISEKMLEVAMSENGDSRIRYINMPMEEIAQLPEKFDVVISSLAFHYVEDFEGVVKNVYNLIDENGNKLHLNLADYGVEGERESVYANNTWNW